MRNDNDDRDYDEGRGQQNYQRRLERMLINRDPFYPTAYHEQDVLSREGLIQEDGEDHEN